MPKNQNPNALAAPGAPAAAAVFPAAPAVFPAAAIALLAAAAALLGAIPPEALFAGDSGSAQAEKTRVFTDMRGVRVTVPEDLRRVATIDDGFVEEVMTRLGVVRKTAAIASWSMKRSYRYEYETMGGEVFAYEGLNTMKFLHPWLDALPCFNSPQGDAINFEALAAARPELAIIRAGDCTIGASEAEKLRGVLETLEALGIPAAVIFAPSLVKGASLDSMGEEIRVVGDAFGKPGEAAALWEWLRSAANSVSKMAAAAPESAKSRVAYLGLNPDLKKRGALAAGFGLNTPESYVIESLAHAQNAFRGRGRAVPLNLEKLYAMDPDAIILPTHNGYHPPLELYGAPYFYDLRELRAVREKRVHPLPWTPMNCAPRLEFPLDILITAKAAYPELFADVRVSEYALSLYRELYGASPEEARGLRSTQLLDWTEEHGF
jgi:iron complex transport system substrate-binding protein